MMYEKKKRTKKKERKIACGKPIPSLRLNMSFSANQSLDYVAGRETRMKTKKDLKRSPRHTPS